MSDRTSPRLSITFATVLCIPVLLYAVVALGSTVVVWTLVDFDLWRLDVWMSAAAFAAAFAFLRRHARRVRGRAVGEPGRIAAIVLNLLAVLLAASVAATRTDLLRVPALTSVIVLISASSLINALVLKRERTPT